MKKFHISYPTVQWQEIASITQALLKSMTPVVGFLVMYPIKNGLQSFCCNDVDTVWGKMLLLSFLIFENLLKYK
jgi:hypothetical protein